jgi:regulator of sigma E protease
MLYLISFIVLIGIMILIHELGHYWAARYFDVRVITFSIGFGPRLFGWRKNETDFRVSVVPLGGYVKMAGDQPGDPIVATEPRSFLNKPRWQRLIIAFAGPLMNMILAVGLLTGLYMWKFPKPVETDPGMIGLVEPNSAAAKAGAREGDRILAIDGQPMPSWEEIRLTTLKNANRPLAITLLRDGQRIETTLTPVMDERHGTGVAGWVEKVDVRILWVDPELDAARQGLRAGDILVAANGIPLRSMTRLSELVRSGQDKPVELTYQRDGLEKKAVVTPSYREREGVKAWLIGVHLQPRVEYLQLSFLDALRESTDRNLKGVTLIYDLLIGIVEQRMSPKTLEGPLRIAEMSGEAARAGVDSYIELMAGVSLNLAVLNLLPIPILDGGVILLLLIEMLFRRELSLQFKENVMKFGFVFLVALVVFVLYNDITKILARG